MSDPSAVVYLLMALFGACLGSAVNYAVYEWAWFLERPVSPFQRAHAGSAERRWSERLPIVGWWIRRSESDLLGSGFWVRPLLIEISFAVGIPVLLGWMMSGGPFPPFAVVMEHGTPRLDPQLLTWAWVLFGVFVVFFALLAVATFVDLDEQTIPDQVTIPGTLLAVLLAASGAPSQLPIDASVAGLSLADDSPREIAPLTFRSPAAERDDRARLSRPDVVATDDRSLDPRERDTSSSVYRLVPFMVAAVVVWWWALLPKLCTARFGWVRGFRLMVASVLRPSRRLRGRIDLPPRRIAALTWWVTAATAVLGSCVLIAAFGDEDLRVRVASSLFGMAVGGGSIWVVRIVASYALGQEAMGFGDVTLMGMIGAFLGWQPALLVFALAPFSAVVIAVVQFVVTRRSDIAFGPYLCVSALAVVIGWDGLWNDWASPQIFVLGDVLVQVLLVALVLMAVMLLVWGWVKRRLGWME